MNGLRWTMRAALCGAALGLAWSASDCSGSGSAGSGGATASGVTSSTSSASSSSSTSSCGASSDAGPCEPWPLPDGVPDGWVEYTDWSCDCRFYVPGCKEVLPEPIKWEKCPASLGPVDCRMMVTDWTDFSTPIAFDPDFDVLPDGKGILAFRRVGADFLYDLVADVDGPVHTAILRVGDNLHEPDPGCYIVHPDVNDGRFILSARGHDQQGTVQESTHGGAIAGAVDDLYPKVLAHYTDDDLYSWNQSANWVVRIGPAFELLASPWSMAYDIFITSPAVDPEGLSAGQWVLHGDAFFWATGTLISGGINVWTPEGGTRPFIRWLNDYTRMAGDLGTDGVDLVWSYGEGKTEPSEEPFPIRSIMTAQFTTDPEKVKATARRLRSQPFKGIGNYQFVVGCGYAAHEGCCNNSYVVRLSDGVAWQIPGKYPDPMLQTPIGLTCEEVFVLAEIGRTTIARIRLDSLGPGMPPD